MASSISNTTKKKNPLLGLVKAGAKTAADFLAPGISGLHTINNSLTKKPAPAPVNQQAQSMVNNALTARPTQQQAPQQPAPVQSPYQPPQQSVRGLLDVPPTLSTVPTADKKTTTKGGKQEKPFDYKSALEALMKASSPNKTQTDLVAGLTKTGEENKRIAEQARLLSEQYGSEISKVGQLGAGAVAGNLSTGTNIVGSGNAAIASQSASSRMSALAAGQQAALEGTGQQLTAQQQLANAQAQALGGANTQQSAQISGIGTAAGYAQPQVAGYGQTSFNPLTGTFGGGTGNLDPQNVATGLAQKVASGQMTYEQAVASLGYAGGAGQQFLNSALQQVAPGFNAPLSSATIGGQQDVYGSLPQMDSADAAAEGIKNKVVTYLASNPQLNPSDLAVGNTLQQWIQGKQLTDPKYQTLFNYLNEYTNTLTPILGVGGSSTNLKTQIAQDFVNAAASGQSIAEVLENIQGLSRGKIQDLRSGATGGGVVSSPTTGSGTGSGGEFDW